MGPAHLLSLLYPFMLTEKYSSVQDLVMISQSTTQKSEYGQSDLDLMQKTFNEIIHEI
jgi:hypothetical protein